MLLSAEQQRPVSLGTIDLILWAAPPGLAGGTLDLSDSLGRTALHHAARNNQAASARALIEAGASMEEQDKAGDTPFVSAIRANAVEALEVEMLLHYALICLFVALNVMSLNIKPIQEAPGSPAQYLV